MSLFVDLHIRPRMYDRISVNTYTTNSRFYSLLDILPLFNNFIDGSIESNNEESIAWEHLSDPLLVGVPHALRSVVLNYQQTLRPSMPTKKTHFPETRRRRSFSRTTRYCFIICILSYLTLFILILSE